MFCVTHHASKCSYFNGTIHTHTHTRIVTEHSKHERLSMIIVKALLWNVSAGAVER